MFGWIWEWIRRILIRLGFRIPGMRISPTSGPPGTRVTLTLDGMNAGEPISVTIGPGTKAASADQSGRATIIEIMHFEPGVYDIVVVVGSNPADEVTLQAQFTVTSP